jgi:hypothetical protein
METCPASPIQAMPQTLSIRTRAKHHSTQSTNEIPKCSSLESDLFKNLFMLRQNSGTPGPLHPVFDRCFRIHDIDGFLAEHSAPEARCCLHLLGLCNDIDDIVVKLLGAIAIVTIIVLPATSQI